MAKIQDVYDTLSIAKVKIQLFGCVGTWRQDLLETTQKVGTAIAEDNGITSEEASLLPLDTELGPKAEVAFCELCKFA